MPGLVKPRWEDEELGSSGTVAKCTATAPVVLLVDDEPILLRITQRMLQQRGFTVVAAPDATAALDLLVAGPPFDLMVTDVGLRGVSGTELARRMRRQLPELRVLFVSGFDASTLRLEGSMGPRDAFLGKPYSAGELETRLVELLSETASVPPKSSGVTPRDRLG